MKGLFDLLFYDNYNMYHFFLILGLFILECFYLYNKELKVEVSEKLVLSTGGVSFLISIITILQTQFTNHDYLARFRPKEVSCLLEAYETTWSSPDSKYIEMIKAVHPVCSKSYGVSCLYQIVLLMVFFSLGWIMCQLCMKEKRAFIGFLSYPIGLCIASMIGLLYHIVGVPIDRLSLIIGYFVFMGIAICLKKRKQIEFEIKEIFVQWIIALVVSVTSVFFSLFYMSPDGVVKTFVGFELAENGLTRAEFLYKVEHGIVEPIINCIGWKFSVDFVYGMYILMTICCIGILLTFIGQSAKNKRIGVLFSAIGAILLITNHDVLFCGTYILSNSLMACFVLALVILLIRLLEGDNLEWIIAFLSMAIITIRIEASCYICLLMALFCGIEEFRQKHRKIVFIVGMEMILWQVYMLLFAPRDLMFWNPGRGIIVIGISVITMLIPYFLNSDVKIVGWICANYYELSIIVFVFLGMAMFFMIPNTYFDVAQVFLAHFASAPESNSLALWGFVLLMLPIILGDKRNMPRLLVAFVFDYLMATFFIYACRTNNPIHLGMNDSCRRTIMQIMPTAMFVIAYVIGDMKFDREQ